jgi:hypothetical protein
MENNLPRPQMTPETRQIEFNNLLENITSLTDGILNNAKYDEFIKFQDVSEMQDSSKIKLSLVFTAPNQVTVTEGERIGIDKVTDATNLLSEYTIYTLDRRSSNISFSINPASQSVLKMSYKEEPLNGNDRIRVLQPVFTELNSKDDFAAVTELLLVCRDYKALLKPEKVKMVADIEKPQYESFINNFKNLFRKKFPKN